MLGHHTGTAKICFLDADYDVLLEVVERMVFVFSISDMEYYKIVYFLVILVVKKVLESVFLIF